MEYKLIDYRLFEPHLSFFKSSKNDKAKFQKLLCNNYKNCNAFKCGKCVVWSGFSGRKCPYGKKIYEYGFTQRARGYSKWISDRREQIKDIEQLSNQSGMCVIGDYIYFPYPFWSLANSIPLLNEERSRFLSDAIVFLSKDRFDIDFIEKLINARPHAMMGGEITDYQKKHVPLIVAHLRERMPDLFSNWVNKYSETYKRFEVIEYIGRVAKLNTLAKNCKLDDNSIWDGKKIIISEYNSSFLPFKGLAYMEIIPNDNEKFKITNNNQVDDNTIFVD